MTYVGHSSDSFYLSKYKRKSSLAMPDYNWTGIHPALIATHRPAAENLVIKLATIYNIQSSNGPQVKPSGIVQLLHMEKPNTSWLPTTLM